jgi:hexosaminidase
MKTLCLLPAPRQLHRTGAGAPAGAAASAQRDPALPAQGYALSIDPQGVRIGYADADGLRHARATLAQIRAQSEGSLPGLRIRDWPDFAVRGYLLDVSRDRVPTRTTLARLVERLALLRLNQLQLYTEHTYAYRDHEAVWRDASPLTSDDLRWLDAVCRERGIELVANQNCFGHMERWLRHPAYRDRAEAPEGWQPRWGGRRPPSVLAPTGDNARFALGLVRELMENFRSRRVNIGCDETFELGRGRSRKEVAARGRERVYLEHLLRLLAGLHADGCDVQFWGDMLRGRPELVAELPRENTTALVWHYEAPLDPEAVAALPEAAREAMAEFGITEASLRGFAGHVPAFVESGFPFWVCPGTSTWNALVGRLPNARANLCDAAEVGLAQGAAGLLITDWGDDGHLQPPSVSFPPLAYGAAVAWCLEKNRGLDLAAVLDAFVFEDAAGELGAALEAMGAVYAATGRIAWNASPLHTELLAEGRLGSLGRADEAGVRATLDALEAAAGRIARARPACPDAAIVRRELTQAIRLARHGAWRIARAAGFARPSDAELRRDLAEAIEEQRACWLERSRPGGLADSLARLERTLAGYGP